VLRMAQNAPSEEEQMTEQQTPPDPYDQEQPEPAGPTYEDAPEPQPPATEEHDTLAEELPERQGGTPDEEADDGDDETTP
jgi:hypothetical protein